MRYCNWPPPLKSMPRFHPNSRQRNDADSSSRPAKGQTTATICQPDQYFYRENPSFLPIWRLHRHAQFNLNFAPQVLALQVLAGALARCHGRTRRFRALDRFAKQRAILFAQSGHAPHEQARHANRREQAQNYANAQRQGETFDRPGSQIEQHDRSDERRDVRI